MEFREFERDLSYFTAKYTMDRKSYAGKQYL